MHPLVKSAADSMSQSKCALRIHESPDSVDYFTALGQINTVLASILLRSSKSDIAKALSDVKTSGLDASSSDYAKAIVACIEQAAIQHNLDKEAISEDDGAAIANTAANIAIADKPLSQTPARRYKTFKVPPYVYNDYSTALKSDEYADIAVALNEEEMIVLHNEETGERKGLRKKKPV